MTKPKNKKMNFLLDKYLTVAWMEGSSRKMSSASADLGRAEQETLVLSCWNDKPGNIYIRELSSNESRQRQRKRHLKINIWERVTISWLLLFLYCWFTEKETSYLQKWLRVSVFHPDRQNTENILTATENILRKQTFVHLLRLLWETNGQSWVGSVTPSCLLGCPLVELAI